MTAAAPELRRLGTRRASARSTWWSAMGMWWRPATGLAAAATALLLLTDRPTVLPEPSAGSVTLSLVAAEGDPVALWEALGIQADPVLAMIAFQQQGDRTSRSVPPITQERENR